MNATIVNDFIRFYVEKFNNKETFNEFLFPWIQEHGTKLIHNNNIFTEQTLIDFLRHLNIGTIINNDVLSTFTLEGNRRASILMKYKMINPDGKIYDISQSMFLNYSNNKKFWIQSCLMLIQELC
jgi:hypothetical protein